jgi:5-methylcytosine-specific restriction endonuclease McrA
MKTAVLESARSIKEPIPVIFQAWELLSGAADAHLNGNPAAADALFRQASLPEVWNWTNPAWEWPHLNVRVPKPDGDTRAVPEMERDPVRDLRRDPRAAAVRAAVLARDGYRCRYCGIPVVDADIRAIAHALYPDAIPWHGKELRKQHAAFQCFWLQYDHVVPHSHGGRSSADNVVICCALCNYGKWDYTLRQLGISDPRLRPPEPVTWDGLERLRACRPPRTARSRASDAKLEMREAQAPVLKETPPPANSSAFFLPGAWVRGEYLYTPPIAGKERWFKLGPELIAEPAIRNGISGLRLLCNPILFRRRGLPPDEFLDPQR